MVNIEEDIKLLNDLKKREANLSMSTLHCMLCYCKSQVARQAGLQSTGTGVCMVHL